MKIGIQWRHQLSPATLKEMEALIGGLSAWSNVEHTDDGAHTDINARTVTIDAIRGTALDVVSGLTNLGEAVAAPGALTPPSLDADADNYSPVGIDRAFVLRVSGTGTVRTIGGIQDGPRAAPVAGRLLWVFNAGSNDVVLAHEATTSRDVFRFRLPGLSDVSIPSNNGVLLYYDFTSTRWIMLAGSPGIGGSTDLEFNAGDSGAAIVVDWANGAQQIVTLTANAAVTFVNPTFGKEYRLVFIEGGAGGFTPTFGAEVVIQNTLDSAATVAGNEFLLDMAYTAAGNAYYALWSQSAVVTNSAALTNHAVIVGRGTSAIAALASLGTTTTVLHGNAAGDPSYGPVDLAAEVTGDLPLSSFTPASGASKLLGRGAASGGGDFQEITLGTGLSMSGTVLSASGGGAAAITFIVNGGGSVLTPGIQADLRIPVACTITSIEMVSDQVGSCVVDIQKDTYTNFPPTNADSIINTGAGGVKPTLSSAVKSQDTTLAHITTAISAGDYLRFVIDSASVLTRLTLTATVSVP